MYIQTSCCQYFAWQRFLASAFRKTVQNWPWNFSVGRGWLSPGWLRLGPRCRWKWVEPSMQQQGCSTGAPPVRNHVYVTMSLCSPNQTNVFLFGMILPPTQTDELVNMWMNCTDGSLSVGVSPVISSTSCSLFRKWCRNQCAGGSQLICFEFLDISKSDRNHTPNCTMLICLLDSSQFIQKKSLGYFFASSGRYLYWFGRIELRHGFNS